MQHIYNEIGAMARARCGFNDARLARPPWQSRQASAPSLRASLPGEKHSKGSVGILQNKFAKEHQARVNTYVLFAGWGFGQ